MAPKQEIGFIKLQIPAGQANPAPPVGPALGQHGVNIMDFCKAFNDKTKDQMGMIIPVEITVFADRSFTFIIKTPPAAVLLKKAAGLDKGSGEPNRDKVGTVSESDLEQIAETKMESGYTFQQEQLLHALENEVCTGMLMCNPRVTGFTSFAKAVLNFINDKKAPRTKKDLYNYLVKNNYYNGLHKFSWSKR